MDSTRSSPDILNNPQTSGNQSAGRRTPSVPPPRTPSRQSSRGSAVQKPVRRATVLQAEETIITSTVPLNDEADDTLGDLPSVKKRGAGRRKRDDTPAPTRKSTRRQGSVSSNNTDTSNPPPPTPRPRRRGRPTAPPPAAHQPVQAASSQPASDVGTGDELSDAGSRRVPQDDDTAVLDQTAEENEDFPMVDLDALRRQNNTDNAPPVAHQASPGTKVPAASQPVVQPGATNMRKRQAQEDDAQEEGAGQTSKKPRKTEIKPHVAPRKANHPEYRPSRLRRFARLFYNRPEKYPPGTLDWTRHHSGLLRQYLSCASLVSPTPTFNPAVRPANDHRFEATEEDPLPKGFVYTSAPPSGVPLHRAFFDEPESVPGRLKQWVGHTISGRLCNPACAAKHGSGDVLSQSNHFGVETHVSRTVTEMDVRVAWAFIRRAREQKIPGINDWEHWLGGQRHDERRRPWYVPQTIDSIAFGMCEWADPPNEEGPRGREYELLQHIFEVYVNMEMDGLSRGY